MSEYSESMREVKRFLETETRIRAMDAHEIVEEIHELEDRAVNRDELFEEMVGALKSLLTIAALLQQNAEGCAVNHYGEDFNIHGMPGWLADCEKEIESARVLLTRIEEMEK